MVFKIELEGIDYSKPDHTNEEVLLRDTEHEHDDPAAEPAKVAEPVSNADTHQANITANEPLVDNSDKVGKKPKRYIRIGAYILAVVVAAGTGAGIAGLYLNQGKPSQFVANEQTPVIKQGSEPTAKAAIEIDIPPFIGVDSDCVNVVEATVKSFSRTATSEATVGETTLSNQKYTVDGKKSIFNISTCGLEQLPISDTGTVLNGSPVGEIDIKNLLPVVKPAKGNKDPEITPETTADILEGFGYGKEEALCNFATNILGCNGKVVLPAEEIERAKTTYTAIAASLAIEKCGPEAFAKSLERLATAASSPEYATTTLVVGGMDSSKYVNKGKAAIAEASVVGIDELNQNSPEDQPEIKCKVNKN